MTNPASDGSLSDACTMAMLRNLASEINGVSADCRVLERIVNDVFVNAPQDQLIEGLQSFDRIIQTLDSVGYVLDGLAERQTKDGLLSGIGLADVAARLGGAAPSSTPVSAGDAEIW